MAQLSNLLAGQSNLVVTQDLATVATTGSYVDLTNKPAIPSIAGLATTASLATVATTGSYNDLTNKPVVISLKISSIDYPGDDLAADPVGGQAITLTGTGFEATPVVYIGGALAPSVTFVSSTELLVTTPARTAGTYDIYVVNPGGATAIMVFGISYSGTPAWTTPAGSLGTFSGTFSVQLQASGDAPVTYSLTSGSVLPSGVTLSSGGLLTGSGIATSQAFNFSVTAIDGQNQDTPRTFLVSIVVSEPFFRNVSLLLQGNGTNGAQNNTFLDSSTNNFAITRSGNTTQGSFSPYGPNWSNFFNGSTDRLRVTNTGVLDLGSGDFSVECWFFSSTALNAYTLEYAHLFGKGNGNEAGTWALGIYQSKVYFVTGGFNVQGSTNVTANSWNHFAATRSGSTVRVFVNGVLNGSGTSSQNITSSTSFNIGDRQPGDNSAQYPFNGHISNVRVVVGTAVYTSSFTPSTAPLTAVSGTQLLTCQSNRFVDNSTNNFTLSIGGTPSVQRFSPFAPPAPYNPATIGGSGYFDGVSTTELLAGTGTSSAFDFGTGDFTIECWVYITAQASSFTMIASTTGVNQYWGFGSISTGGMSMFAGGSGTDIYSGSANTPSLNQWNHLVWQRNSGTASMYLNGARVYNATYTADFGTSATGFKIGKSDSYNNYYANGYISNFRVVKGSAVYSGAAISIPTAPITAVTNTQLLLNMTNASIFDNAMMNNLETVGNAQISTSVVKYGTGSLAFDGTGDSLATRSTPNLAFGSGNFTIECWAYANALGSYNAIFAQWPDDGATANNSYVLETVGSNMFFYWVAGTTLYGPATLGTIATGSWNHWAICRSGNTLYPFKNGVLGTTISITEVLNSPASAVTVGGAVAGGGSWNGYIDDLRITKGVARYTANFTPPTAAFPAS